ncbi:MAG: hypothetical protein Fur0041_11830 [Bacteroidia bacterium]
MAEKKSIAKSNPAQQEFIEMLKKAIPDNHSLVDELSAMLEVSTDSAYRRIRGETALTIDEVSRLCAHYKIPFNASGQHSGPGSSVTFNYHHLSDDFNNFHQYFENVVNDLKRIKSTNPKEIIFAAEDIPIFHHFIYPNLTSFKLFYWTKSILNVQGMDTDKYNPDAIPQSLKDIVHEIYKLYQTIPSVEIWTEDTINSTLKQIEFYLESGFFTSKEEPIQILEEIRMMVAQLEKQASHSLKFSGNAPEANCDTSFTLYCSDLMIGNNCILVTIGGTRLVYLVHNTFNSMVTTSPSFVAETDRWMKNLIRKSMLLSGVSEKQRNRFFKKLNDKINRLLERINSEE